MRTDRRSAPKLDVTKLRAYHSYAAVTEVSPFGEHFTLWYYDEAPVVLHLRATRSPDGDVSWALEQGDWGKLGVRSHEPSPVPPPAAPFAEDLATRLRTRCPRVRGVKIAYEGSFRRVELREFVIHQAHRPETPVRLGWQATVTVAMDAELTMVLRELERSSGFGVIEMRNDAQWLDVPSRPDGSLWAASEEYQTFSDAITEAARRLSTGKPSLDPLALVPASAPLLPENLVGRLQVKVRFYAIELEGSNPSRQGPFTARVVLDLSDAVFGPFARGEAEVNIGESRYKIRAILTPALPLAPLPDYTHHPYTGSLTLRITNEHDQHWQNTFPAQGLIEAEHTRVMAPYGLTIAGTDPVREPNSLHDNPSARPPFKNIDFYVDRSMAFDPRN